MNYKKLFQFKEVTKVGLIGTGAFGRSFLVQSRLISNIRVSVVCDQDLEIAERLPAPLWPHSQEHDATVTVSYLEGRGETL